MNKWANNLSRLTIALFAVVAAGCQTLENKKHTQSFEQTLQSGNYGSAAAIAISEGSIKEDGSSKELLWSLQAGAALANAGDYAYSNAVLDNAESFMKIEDLENLLKKGGEQLTAILLNNSFNDYDPAVYDGVMVNTIKAVNFLKLKDYENARIEFNRSMERQRLAEEFFRKKIEEQEKKKAEERSGGANVDQNLSSSRGAVDEQFPELSSWEVYPDFVNPYTDYMHSLFFFLTGSDSSDMGKARDSIRRVAGMVPDNEYIKVDLSVIDNVARGKWTKRKLIPAVWVVFENGLAPKIDEILIPLPLVLATNELHYAQIALPKLAEGQQAFPYLEVSTSNGNRVQTQELASIERVIQTEFKKEYPYRVTQAVMSTTVKAVMQHNLQKQGGVASLLGALYQAATTRADTRSWSALPKEYQVARLRRPADGKLTISAPGNASAVEVALPDGQFAIIHVKATTSGSALTYDVFTL